MKLPTGGTNGHMRVPDRIRDDEPPLWKDLAAWGAMLASVGFMAWLGWTLWGWWC